MNDSIGRFKVNQTMYFDYGNCYWNKDKPQGKYKEDYDLMRTGTLLEAYALQKDEQIYFDGDLHMIECQNNKHSVYFKDLNDLYNCDWLDEIVRNKSMKTIYSILMREVNRETGEIYVKACKKGTQEYIMERYYYIKLRSIYNEELSFYVCLQDNEKAAIKALKKRRVDEDCSLYERI